MIKEYTVAVDGRPHRVTVSDEQEALLAAYAAGGAIVGIWDGSGEAGSLKPAEYLVQSLEDIREEFLERIVRRRIGLPWIIAETDRLIIREFVPDDLSLVRKEAEDSPGDEIFQDADTLSAYVRCQYGFFEYGIWAVTEKKSGNLIGKAGITGSAETADSVEAEEDLCLELGYHIFEPYRRLGYAREACQAILDYTAEHLEGHVCAWIKADNSPSAKLLEGLGFIFTGRVDTEGRQCWCPHAECCP